MSDTITFTVPRFEIEAALKKALLERSPYSHEEAPLLLAARYVIKDQQKAIVDLIAGQVRSLVDDKAVAVALRERLSSALTRAIEEKAGSIARSLTKADIASLLVRGGRDHEPEDVPR